MRYEVTVFGMLKGKKTRIWSIHIEAASPREAIAQAEVDLKAARIVEVQEIEDTTRPVRRVEIEDHAYHFALGEIEEISDVRINDIPLHDFDRGN